MLVATAAVLATAGAAGTPAAARSAITAHAALVAALPVPTPTITGPVAGVPAVQPPARDLAAHGYVEEEYFVDGTARAFVPSGPVGADGRWDVSPSGTAPYRTRIVVRRPSDPKRFNGSVVVEWFNVTGGIDAGAEFAIAQPELLRGGYAWVGVSAQEVGVKQLKQSARYASLAHPGDDYSYDIYSQVGQAIRHPQGANMLGSGAYKVAHIIAVGESQSGIRLTTYVDAIHPVSRVYDAFLLHSRFAADSGIGGGAAGAVPRATFIRTDLHEPVLVLLSETDVTNNYPARQRDSSHYRLWEVAGTAHYDEAALAVQLGLPASELAAHPPLGCTSRLNSAPMFYVVDAALDHLRRWVDDGTPAPHAPREAVDAGPPPAIQRDELGNGRGGIRLPQLVAPTATLSGAPAPGSPGFCVFFGSTIAFDAARLASLYPTHAAYVAKFTAAVDALERAGFILRPDAKAAVREAAASDVGR